MARQDDPPQPDKTPHSDTPAPQSAQAPDKDEKPEDPPLITDYASL